MSTSLAVITKELDLRRPMFQQLLPPSVTPDRLIRTVVMSVERLPKLLECSPQSVMNAAMTAAVLGLECDGVTGQGYIIPFKGQAVFVPGYKGMNTLAARSGYTITASVVREGDDFEYELGTSAYLTHKPNFASRGRIVAAWATATSRGRPPIIAVMSIEEILQIKEKSPGGKRPDSPWNDMGGPGFAAMCEKTVRRRLSRSLPLTVLQQVGALEDAVEKGQPAYLDAQGDLTIVGEGTAEGPVAVGTIVEQQPADILTPANPAEQKPDRAQVAFDGLARRIDGALNAEALDTVLSGDLEMKQIAWMLEKRPELHDRLYKEHVMPKRATFAKGTA